MPKPDRGTWDGGLGTENRGTGTISAKWGSG